MTAFARHISDLCYVSFRIPGGTLVFVAVTSSSQWQEPILQLLLLLTIRQNPFLCHNFVVVAIAWTWRSVKRVSVAMITNLREEINPCPVVDPVVKTRLNRETIAWLSIPIS